MIIRGGTSKGLYFLESDLPPEGGLRDAALLRLMGSPDIRQIDGLGGAVSVTSKTAILSRSARDDADVDYTFAQVSVDKPVVSYAGNCGNISAGVGPFAIESGLVPAQNPVTRVRVFNTNTKKIIIEDVQTPGGNVTYEGDYSIPGVPGRAAPIKVLVQNPAGAVCGSLLPTGNPADSLEVPGFGTLEVSIVDAANPLVFVRARDVGMTGKETPAEIDANAPLLELLERIRGSAALLLGMITRLEDSAVKSPGVPKLTIVSPSAGYTTVTGEAVAESQSDLTGRMMAMQKAHPTFALTGAMCTAAAAVIPGTIVAGVRRGGFDHRRLRIAHAGGIFEAGADYSADASGAVIIESTYGFRTARLLMKGEAFL
jgi:2-methylaconitate cis-trans-isomerase PrpF